MSTKQRPERRHEITIRLSADDGEAAIRALEQLAFDWSARGIPPRASISAGWSSSWSIEHVERPEQTSEQYRADLAEYVTNSGGQP